VVINQKLVEKLKEKKQETIDDLEKFIMKKRKLLSQKEDLQQKMTSIDSMKNLKNIWIVKPGENTNRGVDISVHTKVSEIKEIINAESKESRTFIL
jgi:hypothetical protein